MISIVKANSKDAELLSEIAIPSFMESHGHSASREDINSYITEKYNTDTLREELGNEKNIFHFIYAGEKLAGFSKIIFNFPYEESPEPNITKLEKIFILQEFYDRKIGKELFEFNRNLAISNGQAGIWLFVWIENLRAIRFYEKNGFKVVGSHDFRISPGHTNPNHRMLLLF
jgi:ribosomal protein S18 acetylase RimI-like enzyme